MCWSDTCTDKVYDSGDGYGKSAGGRKASKGIGQKSQPFLANFGHLVARIKKEKSEESEEGGSSQVG